MRRLILCLLFAFASPVLAVNASHWVHTSEADFKKGNLRNVVATNLGDLKLSRAIKKILEQDAKVSAVYCLAGGPDGSVYAGTGPHGLLLRVKGDKVETIYEPKGMMNIFSMLVDSKGRLLLGTGGEKGQIFRLDNPGVKEPKVEEIFSEAEVQYIWAIQQTSDGNLYAATGPNGQVFEIKPDGSKSVLLDSDENNILSLISDGKDTLYAGTDPNGLVYRINRKTKEAFVLFDAPESEVSALALDAKGNLYAGTAEANEKPAPVPGTPGEDEGNKEKAGRPEGTGGVPIPSQPPENPKPPAVPAPNPGEPNPIPKGGKLQAAVDDGWHGQVLPLGADREGYGQRNIIERVGEFKTQKTRYSERFSRKCEVGSREGFQGQTRMSAPPVCRISGHAQWSSIAHATHEDPVYLSVNGWQKILHLEDDPGGDDPGSPPAVPGPVPAPGKQPKPAKPVPANANSPQNPVPVAPEPIDFGKPKVEGNAIYRIDPEGFVREIFRQPVMVMTIIERNGVLLVGTGSDGLIYQVDPAAEETVVLAKVDPKQVLSMIATKDGRIVLGMANVGGIASMSSGFAEEGAFTSPVLDAAQISRFGKIHLTGTLPKNTSLTLSTRSGNLQDPDKPGWSNWTEETPAVEFAQIKSPSARFLQYRLSLTSNGGKESPVVDEVDVAYQMPNLAPVVKSIKVGNDPNKAAAAMPNAEGFNPVAAAAAPKLVRNSVESITWEAEDANGDALQYNLYFRTGSKSPWILLKDKLTENHFDWDTRTVADGRYAIKVVASDELANVPGQGKTSSRMSDPVVVDNTPPAIGDIKSQTSGSSAHITASIVDRMTTVASFEYSIDSGGDWQAVLPSDNIFDGPEEKVDFTLSKLTPGAHQITLRAGDAKGNHAYETVLVNIEAQAGK